MIETVLQVLSDNWRYACWLIFTGAGCLALASLHTNEKDYDDEDNIW